jgi:hypothetical protein
MCSGSCGGAPAWLAEAVPAGRETDFPPAAKRVVPAMVATATRPFSSARTTKRAGPSLVVRVSRALIDSAPVLPTRARTLPRRRSTLAPPDRPG